MKNKAKQNPFIILFVCFALICTLALGILFLSIIRTSSSERQARYYTEKLETVLNDLDTQIGKLQTLAFRFSLDNTYKYSVLTEKTYNANILLNDFKSYRYASALSEEFFLYYGETNIYHVVGNTIDLNVYLRSLSEEGQTKIKETLTTTLTDMTIHVVSADNEIYIMIPFKTGYGSDAHNALLACVVTFANFEERLQTISGGLNGEVSLYKGNQLLYSNCETPVKAARDVLFSSIQEEEYSIYYRPAKDVFSTQQFLLELLLILIDVSLILFIAQKFAEKAFKPIRDIRTKYDSPEPLSDDANVLNAFAEIDIIINNALQHSKTAAKQVEEKQTQLKLQLLNQLLHGIYSPDVRTYLEALQISLPGPYYFVICLSLDKKTVSDDFFPSLQRDLEEYSSTNSKEFIYAIADHKAQLLKVICSLQESSSRTDMVDYVTEVADSYSQDFLIGVGKTYDSLEKLSASWLESNDNLTNTSAKKGLQDTDFIYDSYDLQLLETALSSGSAEDSLQWLENYVHKQERDNLSLLMQQYAFSEFTGKISKLSRLNGITLSNQNISLLISARNITSFYEAAREVILEYCQKFQEKSESRKDDQTYLICRYIQEHFMEYDISIEIIAENLGVSTATVRDAVLKATGKMYKDYLVCLRMEYAKTLLQEGELSVAEVSNAVGYSSVSYFIRLFKNMQGTTPAKYLKRKPESGSPTK